MGPSATTRPTRYAPAHSDREQGVEVEVRLFGALADRAGARSVTVTVPDGATVGEVVAAVGERHSEIAEAAGRVSVAVDLEVVGAEQPVPAGAEVALLPPVAGGCGAR